jgi:hypothetical protein
MLTAAAVPFELTSDKDDEVAARELLLVAIDVRA